MDQHPYYPPEPKSKRLLLKIFGGLFMAVIIFYGGYLVGHSGLGPATSGKSGGLDYSSVDRVYDLLKKDFDGQLDNDKLLDGAKRGLADATGDPYTVYFNPEEAKDFQESLTGSFAGIGAELGGDEDDNIVIVSPLKGFPAHKAGLKPKDVIAAIDDKSTDGLSVDEAVKKIRGAIGTKVKLSIIRDKKSFDVTLTRTKISIPIIEYELIGNIGYLKISQFTEDTLSRAQEAIKAFQNRDVKGIVLDVRGNPGGFLDSAVDIASLWLKANEVVVSERRGEQVIDTLKASGASVFEGLKTVVLIDGGSASASEILAGALDDHEAATLVGERSFGKGSVQQVEKLLGGAELKVTVARWFTPDGRNIDKQGIAPDVKVKIPESAKEGDDPQKAKALQILKN